MSDLLTLLLEESPAMKVRIILREHAKRGTTFEKAWLHAMQSMPRHGPEAGEWRTELHDTKPQWRDAYEQLTGTGTYRRLRSMSAGART